MKALIKNLGSRDNELMRILVDQAVYDMRNKGNVALLQVALRRFRDLWPQASLEVMTTAPHMLRLYCPGVIPVDVYGVHNWSQDRGKYKLFHRLVPNPILRFLLEVREELSFRQGLRRWGRKNVLPDDLDEDKAEGASDENRAARGSEDALPPDLGQALQGADAVIATGGGYLVDSDKGSAIHVLSLLEKAVQSGKFTAMVGQGMGRMDDRELFSLARKVLPHVDLILVREEVFSVPLLRSLDVPLENILVTGDDAVELGYEARPMQLGTGIGVGIRLATYTEVASDDLDRLRPLLHQAAFKCKARLVGLPTTCTGPAADQMHIAKLLAGYPNVVNSSLRLESIPSLIHKVGLCRVVITGAFHSAVFALAQGIPVIGLSKSGEYSIKFKGLIDQFGTGCTMLHLDHSDFENKFADAFERAWESAELLRPGLIESARKLIDAGRDGYQRVYEAYETRRIHQSV